MMHVEPLALCGKCDQPVVPSEQTVTSFVDVEEGRRIYFRCEFCGSRGSVFLSGRELARRREQLREDAAERDAWNLQVKRMLELWRFDLEAVETVEDLQLYWHDQEVWKPWTVLREGRL